MEIETFIKPYKVKSMYTGKTLFTFTKGYIERIKSIDIIALWGINSDVQEQPYLLTITKAHEYLEVS